jgi:hypothetical protein
MVGRSSVCRLFYCRFSTLGAKTSYNVTLVFIVVNRSVRGTTIPLSGGKHTFSSLTWVPVVQIELVRARLISLSIRIVFRFVVIVSNLKKLCIINH